MWLRRRKRFRMPHPSEEDIPIPPKAQSPAYRSNPYPVSSLPVFYIQCCHRY